VSQDSVYVKTRNKQSGQKRRGGDSSRRQGPENKTIQTKANTEEKAAEQEEDPGRQL